MRPSRGVAVVVAVIAVVLILLVLIGDTAEGQSGTTTTTTTTTEPTVVKERVKKPPKRIERKRSFTPDAQPSPSRVIEIAAIEQARWGGPSIVGRMQCESNLRWNATNGQYRGLLQIGPIWGYLYGGAPRGVRLRSEKKVKRPVIKIIDYSDGTQDREKLRTKKVKVVTIRKGKLPAGADPYHGWAAIRVGQLAVSGGRTTSWSCGL